MRIGPFRLLLTVAALLLAAQGNGNAQVAPRLADCPAIDVVAGGEREEGPELNEALAWRRMTLADESGQIDPSSLYVANLLRSQSLHPTSSALSGTSAITTSNWISHGPQNGGGRTRAILVNPSNPNQIFAGSASGGIWISNSAGTSWSKTPGYMTNLATEALVFDSSSTSIIYAGTGEYSYPDALLGAGVFKSVDGGQSWTQLRQTLDWHSVQTLATKPGKAGFVLAGTETGIWKTEDFGETWQKVYPTAPKQSLVIHTLAFDATGKYVVAALEDQGRRVAAYSTDGGSTFNPSTIPASNGFYGGLQAVFAPSAPPPALPVAYMFRNPDILKSIDGGQSFQFVSTQPSIATQQTTLWVAPNDPNFLVAGGLNLWRSRDGGVSFQQISTWPGTLDGPGPHVDQHAIVGDPNYGSANHTVYIGNDGGIYATADITQPTASWTNLNHGYQTTQFYSGAGSALGAAPLIGGTQDQGTIQVTAASFPNGRIMLGGDGGFVAIDPAAPNTMYAEFQSGFGLYRSLDGGANLQRIDNFPNGDSFSFIVPFIVDPNSRTTLLVGGSKLWRTRNADTGTPTASWTPIRQATPCQPLLFPTCMSLISAIAVAPGNPDVIWVGLVDGRLDKTTNGTSDTPAWDWKDDNATRNPLPNRFITRISIDPADSNVVYVTFGGYKYDNIYKTTDGGVHWQPITSGIPAVPVRGIARHPRNARQLYAATDVGVYESNDGGLTWVTSSAGPDDVAVDEVSFVNGSERLLAATHGRGLWTADTSGVPCLYRLSATNGLFPSPTTSTGTFNVLADPACSWTATVDPAASQWLHVTSASASAGNGTVTFTVDPNTTGLTRSGAIVVGGQRFVAIQSVGCSVNSLTPTGGFYSGQGGTASFDVAADAQCQWTAIVDTASADWITITSPQNGQVVSGNSTVTFQLKPNTAPGNPGDPTTTSLPRYGKIVVNQKVFFANQAGVRPPQCPVDSNHRPTFSIRGPSTIRPDQNLSLVAYPGAGFHYQWSMSPPPPGLNGVIGNDSPILFIRPGVGNPYYPRTDTPTTYFVVVTSTNCPDGVQVSFTATATGSPASCLLPLASSTGVLLSPFIGAYVTLGVGPEPSYFPWTPERPTFQWYSGPSGDTSNPIQGATNDTYTVAPTVDSMFWVKMTAPSCGGEQLSGTALVVVGVPPPKHRAVSHSLSLIGRTDVLFRNPATGADVLQPVDGAGTQLPPVPLPPFDPAWQSQTISDLNGDGRPDIVWRNPATGANAFWAMSGVTVLSTTLLPPQDPSWNMGASADFTGEGSMDLVWQNSATNDLELWIMNGAQHAGSYGIGRLPSGWVMQGSADFDRDGKPDIVFRNYQTGANAIWHMDDVAPPGFAGPNHLRSNPASSATSTKLTAAKTSASGDDMPGVIEPLSDTNWRIASIDDADGDGQPDIIWINSATNEMMYWKMSGLSHVATIPLPPQTDPTLKVAGTPPIIVPQTQATALSVSVTPATFGGTTTMIASLSANGAPVAGGTIAFAIDGTAAGTGVTAGDGTASISASAAGLPAGTHTVTAQFAGDTTYVASNASSSLQILAQPVPIAWPAPAPIVYGTALGSAQLNATAPVAGTFVYTPAAGTILDAGANQQLTVTFTPADVANYLAATASVTIMVTKAAQTIVWAMPADIVYGTPLSSAQLNASVTAPGPASAGSLSYDTATGSVLGAGDHVLTATAAATVDYNAAVAAVSLHVRPSTLVVTWAAPAAITYGTPLSNAQLNAAASVPGTFDYAPASGTVLTAGNHGLQVTFTPTDAKDFTTVTATVTLTVQKATPAVQWAQPAPIVYGTLLSSTQLNAAANVAGTFIYTPPATTKLDAGAQPLSVSFVPADAANYETASSTVTLTVLRATPVIAWPAPAAIVYGTALSATQLNATANVAGVFAYTPAAGAILNGGTAQMLSTQFTPTDSRNYTSATASVAIDVTRAKQTLSWKSPSAIVYGTPLSPAQLNASVSVGGPASAGSLVYTPPSGTVLDAGSGRALTVRAQETQNYQSASLAVSIDVNRAPLSLTVAPKSKLYGAALPLLTGTLAGVVNGDPITPSYTTNATQQSAVGTYPITATLLDPANRLVNYNMVITASTLTVAPAPLQIAANSATKQYSDPMPPFSATFTGFLLGETPAALSGTLAFTTTVTPTSGPGQYPLAVSGVSSRNYTIQFVPGTLTVTPEDARAYYAGDVSVAPTSSKATTVTVTLGATIKDISVTPDAAGDRNPGDIRNASVTFVDRNTGATLCSAPVGLISATDATTGTLTCTATVTLSTAATQQLRVGIIVGKFYARDASSDDTVITISKFSSGSVQGDGKLTLAKPAGAIGAAGWDAIFSFNASMGSSGDDHEDSVDSTFRLDLRKKNDEDNGHQYRITSVALKNLLLNKTAQTGTLDVAATIEDRDGDKKVVLDSDTVVHVTFTAKAVNNDDHDDANTAGSLAITVWNKKGGLWFASNFDGIRTVEQNFIDGHLKLK